METTYRERTQKEARPHDMMADGMMQVIRGANDPSYIVYRYDNNRYAVKVKYFDGKRRQDGFVVVDFAEDKNGDPLNG